jgi:hypothetical protein
MTITQLPPNGGGPADTGACGAFGRALLGMRAELAEVGDTATFGLSGAELKRLLAEVTAVATSVEELQARLVAEADGRDLARDEGCTSTTTWVRSTTGLSGSASVRLAALARELYTERAAPTRAAWASGRLTGEQALVIAEAINTLSPGLDSDRVRAAQLDLIDQAAEHRVEDLRRLANRLIEVVDPETADQILAEQLAAEERRALETTRLRFSRCGDGTTRLTRRLPDLAADMFKEALDGLASPRRSSAKDGGSPSADEHGPTQSPVLNPDGDHSGTEIGPLTQQQRLGRALVELLEHLPTDELPQAGGLNATVVVSVDLESLHRGLGTAVLDTGTEISAGEARRLACNATLLPLVLGGESKVLDLGRGQRLFDRHQRIALGRRDRGCVWPGCDRPQAWCEAHHLQRWSDGGPTDLANGALVCAFHHRLLHGGEWHARMATDGVVEIIPPGRLDPARTPLRHIRFRRRPPC